MTITTTCTSKPNCRIGRTIRRYRYKGPTPPPDSSAPLNLPLAPIVGNASIALRGIKHPILLLAGAPRRYAGVVIEIDCFSKNSGSGGGGPVMYLRVPSRTRIEDLLPGSGTCIANVLVTSTRPGRVKIRVVSARRA